MMETVAYVFGPYAGKMESSSLMASRHGEGAENAKPNLVALHGKRLAYACETSHEGQLNLSRLKEVTGTDTITARALHQNPITFAPTHTLFLQTNHRPKVGDDPATWRRIALIPFEEEFLPNPDRQNPHQHPADDKLMDKLRAEASGILAWIIRGALKVQSEGLSFPDRVQAATSEYRAQEDVIARFIDECGLKEPSLKVGSTALYEAYKEWSLDHGEPDLGQKELSTKIKNLGFTIKPYAGRATVHGLGIKPKTRE
jgi:putative DNA primase/helicase